MSTPSSRHSDVNSVAALARIYAGAAPVQVAGAPPRVAVIGAGVAGLVATHLLQQAGCRASLFEASNRLGGRIRTDFGSQEQGLISEWGGEFIDSSHSDMLALVQCFGLSLIDTEAPSEHLLRTAYHFQGQHRSEAEVEAAFSAVAPLIAADAARLSPVPTRAQHNEADRALDQISIAEYLDGLDAEPWLLKLLRVAYETEFGLDAGEQSCLSLLTLIGTDLSTGFQIFGPSDERYKVKEGTECIIERLGAGLSDQAQLEHRLVSVRAAGQSYRLCFDSPQGHFEFVADAVVLAIPFTLLRGVDLGDLLPPAQQHCVQTLGYGMNAKLMLGLHSRLWRAQGYDGGLYTDLPLQTGWDGSRQRDGERGIYTCFLGGAPALALGQGTVQAQAERMAGNLEAVYPGFVAARSCSAVRMHWPSEPFALGSYSCYKPGQWTQLAGLEGQTAGALYFAGEHCSRDFQGYMNGAAETGRRAAQAIIQRCR